MHAFGVAEYYDFELMTVSVGGGLAGMCRLFVCVGRVRAKRGPAGGAWRNAPARRSLNSRH